MGNSQEIPGYTWQEWTSEPQPRRYVEVCHPPVHEDRWNQRQRELTIPPLFILFSLAESFSCPCVHSVRNMVISGHSYVTECVMFSLFLPPSFLTVFSLFLPLSLHPFSPVLTSCLMLSAHIVKWWPRIHDQARKEVK